MQKRREEKYNSHHGSVPALSSIFPKSNALWLYDGLLHTLRDIIKKDPLHLIFDEWSDERGAAMLAVTGHVLNSMVILRGTSCLKDRKKKSDPPNETCCTLRVNPPPVCV